MTAKHPVIKNLDHFIRVCADPKIEAEYDALCAALREAHERHNTYKQETTKLHKEMRDRNLALVGQVSDLEAENKRLREIVADVGESGVEFQDERVSYVTVQIDGETWEACKKAVARGGE
jgi:hypothetical protein